VNDSQKLQQVWDRQEIEQLMYRHARSLDRMDAELMKSTLSRMLQIGVAVS